ncbi:hypothetical protein BCR34DRAFT_290643 [Clohesyomyces aquaticus]|uniref:Extracellular membrane protein CFEM domain-containing protein n=1 Tax=Clohesyomyces aquaticus TaxID=1231657 RepID=A0A1Y1ZQV9_9PLEO|nr:hypothetical protein BCR34DRAFT_290643 [Clohesyomyces aquaticus]
MFFYRSRLQGAGMARLPAILLVLLSLPLTFGQQIVTASIQKDPGYLLQKDCVKSCIFNGWGVKDLMPGIGCSSPFANECLCRADQESPASKYLTTCVNSSCGTSATADLVRAVSVYDGYCSGAGYPHANGQAQTTPPNSNPQAPTATKVTLVTETAKTSNAASQSSTISGEFRVFVLKLVALAGTVTCFLSLR